MEHISQYLCTVWPNRKFFSNHASLFFGHWFREWYVDDMTEEIVDTDRTKIEQSTNQHFSVLVIFSVKWTVLLNKEVKSRKIERDCVLQYYSTARTVITCSMTFESKPKWVVHTVNNRTQLFIQIIRSGYIPKWVVHTVNNRTQLMCCVYGSQGEGCHATYYLSRNL